MANTRKKSDFFLCKNFYKVSIRSFSSSPSLYLAKPGDSPPFPVASYLNPFLCKKDILKDNWGKTGIYMWTNVYTGSTYEGAALNLSRRLTNYYSKRYLLKSNKGKSVIYNALLKNSMTNFKLDILEYCAPSNVIEKEQYYISLLNPNYNILLVARSSQGFKHSKETIELLREKALNREKSVTFKHYLDTKLKMSESNLSKQDVIVTNDANCDTFESVSITKAAKFIGASIAHVARCLKKDNIYKGKGYTTVQKL